MTTKSNPLQLLPAFDRKKIMKPFTPADSAATPNQDASDDEVAAFLAAHQDIETVEYLLPDINGAFRGKWAPAASLKKVFSDGMPLPMSIFGLDVWGREVEETGLHIDTGDKDGFCFPIPGSLKRVTWAQRPTAQVLVNMCEADRTPFHLDPRHVLQRVLDRYHAKGLTPVVAFELEFYLLSEQEASSRQMRAGLRDEPDRQRMYSLSELDSLEDIFGDIREAALAQELPIDTIISEAGPGQFEVNLLHKSDAMAAADDALLLRRAIAGVARRHGLRATFMAKPFTDAPGNGMHVHSSIIDAAGQNIFSHGDQAEANHMAAIAGMLTTLPQALPLFINTFNGFRRLSPGSYAPTRAIWGYDNRSVAIRVPVSGPAARRVEHRISGADAHPHLVAAAMLAGMLHGIELRLDAPPPTEGNAYNNNAGALTNDLGEALDHFAASDFVADYLGEEFRRVFGQVKLTELIVFESRITRLEYDTYL